MTTLNVRNHEGEPLARTVDLPAEVFDVTVNVPLVHQVVVGQLAAARQGTAKTKTRGEVRGGGAKPYRQKGTGRARQGSTRSPQFTGGGVVHGPVPRDYSQRTPKKMKAAALRSALSDRARGGRVHVVDRLVVGDTPSTKAAVAALHPLTYGRSALVVALRTDLVSWKSLRNVADVHLLDPGQLNTYDVLVSDDVVFLEDALASFLAASGRGARRGTTGPDTPPDLAPHRISSAVPSEVVGEFSTGETPAETASASTAPSTSRATTAAGGTVSENAATSAGSTQAAGDGVSDDEMAREVAAETSSDLDAEPVFEAQHDGAETDTEIAKASSEEISEEVDPR